MAAYSLNRIPYADNPQPGLCVYNVSRTGQVFEFSRITHDAEFTMELVLGTHNRKKGEELRYLLARYGFRLTTLADHDQALVVDEDGTTFQANAQKKAIQQAVHLGAWVLGEDSGLVVDALGGLPGVHTARFAGPQATDADNNALLLEKLAHVPVPQRSAHYVCHMSLSDPRGQILIDCEASCSGRILTTQRGVGGFGYDPLFEIVEYHRTFAELGMAVKSILSHRARASRMLIPRLVAIRNSFGT